MRRFIACVVCSFIALSAGAQQEEKNKTYVLHYVRVQVGEEKVVLTTTSPKAKFHVSDGRKSTAKKVEIVRSEVLFDVTAVPKKDWGVDDIDVLVTRDSIRIVVNPDHYLVSFIVVPPKEKK